MIILGIYHSHDACAALFDDYRMVAAVAQERLTRIKGDGFRFPDEAVDECLAVAGLSRSDVDVVALPRTEYPKSYFRKPPLQGFLGRKHAPQGPDLLREMVLRRAEARDLFDAPRYLADLGFRADIKSHFYNHHASHALAALFHTGWDEGLIYTADGLGDRTYYSARVFSDGVLKDLFGGEAHCRRFFRVQHGKASLGRFYLTATERLGFIPLRHEGKVLGLAAFGEPRFTASLRSPFTVLDDGQIVSRRSNKALKRQLTDLVASATREDVAASVQQVLEDLILEAMERIFQRNPARHLALAGGVFANVKLNQRLAARFPLRELFVYPAMSDQGMAAGGALDFLLARDGLSVWCDRRYRLQDVYCGRDYGSGDAAFEAAGMRPVARSNLARTAAELIEAGKAVGTFIGRMEYGPRALGARSIMASATDRGINDSLNKRLSRTEFMPFAPVVRAERVYDLFKLPESLFYAANFMTVTCDVKQEWQNKIPAVVHVDGTARPQVIARHQNELYYDILHAYEERTGLAALVNTSFNAHEEPIINTPEECANALKYDRVDHVVTPNAIWARPK